MGIGQVTTVGVDVPQAIVQVARDGRGVEGQRAAFLDRDGVVIRAVVRDGRPFPVERPEEVDLLEGAAECCAALRRAGMMVVVVTNQPDVARGTATLAGVRAIHDTISEHIEVDAFVTCPHDDGDGCQCRKPNPGMLTYAADRWDIALTGSFLVGDRWRDIEAGQRCGCRTVFIDHGYDEVQPSSPDFVARGLAEATAWILEQPVP